MKRYFLELAYNGTRYNGFQIQPNEPSIQEAVQHALNIILKNPIEITGCGRTDTGVHAMQYFAHFDYEGQLPDNLIYSLNGLLKKDIAIYRCFQVSENAHARFDAISRSYVYFIDLDTNPFRQETAYYCAFAKKLDKNLVQESAALLLHYSDFETFCKSGTNVATNICHITHSEWIFGERSWEYRISANRFLRGMIRLIVGMCLNVGRGKITLEELKAALDNKLPLKQAWSVPASGLFLTDIIYPESIKVKD